MQQPSQSLNGLILRTLKVMSILVLVWGVLAENAGWTFGLEAVAVATLATLLFVPLLPPRWNPEGLMLFLLYFAVQSVRGGVDVAWRACHPRVPLAPDWLEYRLRLPDGKARVLFLNSISLLPGTLSASLDGNRASIHILAGGPAVERDLARLEERVARFFALDLRSQEACDG